MATFWLRTTSFLLVAASLFGCAQADESAEEPPSSDHSSLEEMVEGGAEGSAELAASETSQAPEPIVEEPVERLIDSLETRPVRVSAAGVEVGRPGGTIVAGDLSVVIPDGALSETESVEAAVVANPEDLERPLPPGAILGAYRTGPWNIAVNRAITIEAPLRYRLEPGLDVELLAWQPAMRAFIVASRGTVDESGTSASFNTRQLGDMLVRAQPVQVERELSRCDVDTMSVHDTFPGSSEDNTVGLTELEDRISRDVAFNVLTDFRLSDAYGLIDFKNEEVNDIGATRRNELENQDEDYLMDPNLAAAVTELAYLVQQEWHDPLTGEPAFRLRLTEAFDALIEHSARSTHYQGRAADITLSPVPEANGDVRREVYGRVSALSVCSGFDYVLFENQFHVHASVVPTEVALAVQDPDGGVRIVTAELHELARLEAGSGIEVGDGGVELARFAWQDDGAFAVEAETGSGEDRFLLTHTGRRMELDEASDVIFARHTSERVGDVTTTALRQLRIRDGRAYLVNASPFPPLSGLNEDGSRVDIVYPFPVPSPDGVVVDAVFRPHARTREAMMRRLEASR